MQARWTLRLMCWVVAGASLGAIFVRADVENVPVERLVQNLERLVAARPSDFRLRLNLARVHAMAFAQRSSEVEVWKGRESEGAWYGDGPLRVPEIAANRKPDAAAMAHLTKAIQRYEEALKLNPTDKLARIGHAWAVDQSGDKSRAIELYRGILRDAWADEQRATSQGFGLMVTTEVALYLTPLLDPVRDRSEIETWKARAKQLEGLPRAITPIAIPLRTGMSVADMVDPSARVSFDADGTGRRVRWTWISRDAGWLVYDQRGSRSIDSALQWFGNVTFWLFWDNGYQALSALDDDGDGRLRGRELRRLAIWRDANQDGVSDRGEVRPLDEWGVTSLSCAYEIEEDGIAVAWSAAGVELNDGTTRATFDVLLHRAATAGGR